MRTSASIAKPPLHPMLVVIPIGLWVASFVLDLIGLADRQNPLWPVLAYFTLLGGLLGALVAAVPGMSDLLSLTDERTRRLGRMHAAANLVVIGLYATNVALRSDAEPALLPIALSAVGLALLGFSGWLGGEMVHVRGVTIDPVPGGATAQAETLDSLARTLGTPREDRRNSAALTRSASSH